MLIKTIIFNPIVLVFWCPTSVVILFSTKPLASDFKNVFILLVTFSGKKNLKLPFFYLLMDYFRIVHGHVQTSSMLKTSFFSFVVMLCMSDCTKARKQKAKNVFK